MTPRNSTPRGAGWKRWTARAGMIVGGLVVIAVCVMVRYYWGAEPASAEAPPAGATSQASPSEIISPKRTVTQPPLVNRDTKDLKVVAVVNGEQISRQRLAEACLLHCGKDVLGSVINKRLIAQECARRHIQVTDAETRAEIERLAKRFGLPVDEWLRMLKKERGITPLHYAQDIIWPTLALRKLAGKQLEITRQELVEAFEAQYGPAVKARLISCSDIGKAQRLRAEAAAHPEQFGELAKIHSEDVPSASAKGLIPPIRKHINDEKVEQVAFHLQEGQVSQVLPLGDQYVILKCEGQIPARKVDFEKVAPQLEELIRDQKLRGVAEEIFRGLEEQSKVVNCLEDPEAASQYPGMAAIINGEQITKHELAEMCIDRHGTDVLEGEINHLLIDQACRRRKIQVTEEEMQAKIAETALEMASPLPDGSPNLAAWLKIITEEQGLPLEVYRRDMVWPAVALRKLVEGTVKVTEEDLTRGYHANYGERVRCRAIVLDNLRRAQQVWEMARENPSEQYFGDLAEQYTIEPTGRSLRGEVPPIQKYGGRPTLEKEAFALQAGQISSIIPADDKFIILFCQGRTQPTDVDFQAVRNLIYEDLVDKKTRIAMRQHFSELKDFASIENHLAGTRHVPRKTIERGQAVGTPSGTSLKQVPGLLTR